jgi:hypothetical protein
MLTSRVVFGLGEKMRSYFGVVQKNSGCFYEVTDQN